MAATVVSPTRRAPAADPPADQPPARSGASWSVAALTAAALVLRLWAIGRQSFWMDEAAQRLMAAAPTPWAMVGDMVGGADRLPPLFHLLVWSWLQSPLPDSDGWLRLLSAVPSAALVPATWLLARRLAPRVAWPAAALVALSPFALHYGQELRPFALAGALAAWSVVWFLRAVDDGRPRSWWWYAALRVLAAYAHPYVLALGAVEAAVALRRLDRRRAFLRAAAAQVAAFGPWLAVLAWLVAHDAAAGFAKDLSPLALGYAGFTQVFGLSLGPSVRELHLGRSPLADLPVLAPAAAAGAVAAWGWYRNRRGTGLVTAYAAVPVAAAFAAALVTEATFNVRYAVAALPFVMIGLAAGLAGIPWRPVRRGAATLVAALMVLSVVQWFTSDRYAKDDFRSATATLAQHHRPGDRVVLVTYDDPFVHYSGGAIPYVSLYDRATLDTGAFAALRADLDREPGGVLWVMAARPWETDPDGEVVAWLTTRGPVTGHWSQPGVELYRVALG